MDDSPIGSKLIRIEPRRVQSHGSNEMLTLPHSLLPSVWFLLLQVVSHSLTPQADGSVLSGEYVVRHSFSTPLLGVKFHPF